jgi:hydrogenase maturation protein HypF
MVRRSRGCVPVPIGLEWDLPAVLAVGGELKTAVCLTKGRNAFVGQHIGDLENLIAYTFFQESIAHLQNILEVQPEIIGYDLHPGYLSTQWALEQKGIRTIGVQHHHAHIASCMAENHLCRSVIGVALDGTGYGTDGRIWGGEVLIAGFAGFKRVAHLEYVPMPGGAQAIGEPWRMAVSQLHQAGPKTFEDGVPLLSGVSQARIEIVRRMAEHEIRSPLTSSCGRLFDAVAALIGLRSRVTFEGQAAMELEACCEKSLDTNAYLFSLKRAECFEIGTTTLFQQIIDDLKQGVSRSTISRRFHNGLVSVVADVVSEISTITGIRQICLSGGCFINRYLLVCLTERLEAAGLQVFMQSDVPAGDGGLSLGQAIIAAHTGRDTEIPYLGDDSVHRKGSTILSR